MKFKYILLTVLTVVLLNACSEDFLDRPSQSALTSAVYFKTQADFESAVNGIYAPLRTFYNNQTKNNTWVPPNLQMGDMHSDNARYYYNPNYRAVSESSADFIPEPNQFSGYWNSYYSWISRANQVLAMIDNEGIEWESTAVRDNLKGQALFMRAWSYWWLAQLYGDACIHLEPVASVEEASVPLSPESEIIGIVITDATAASTLLLNKANQQPGRVTSGTAKMLLAEVAIWEKDYGTAETLLESLAGEYSLMLTYADVFDPNQKNNAESIFEIQYSGATSTYSSNFAYPMMPYPMSADTMAKLTGVSNATALTEGEGYCTPTPLLLAAYEPGDERFDVTIRYIYNANDSLVPTCVKYLHPHSLNFQADENMPIWRYAEALLYLAEAINEQPGSRQAEAMGYVNEVRNRAGLVDNTTATTQQEVRDAILQERRIELAFEGKRFWDLVRFDLVEDVVTDYGAAVRADPIGYYLGIGIDPVPTAFTDFRTKFEIPDGERLVNPYID
ncbi:MAG: RagB/SusD family nutrient uptake outer membrane protein [Bacteroidales bacterium]|nr:RagB/SusD family nutrient uptake outer membrane protein [Bacteroidales bacterium]